MKNDASVEIAWHESLQGSMGAAHAISDRTDAESAVEALRRTVEEVTGYRAKQPERRIGFV